jgi:hypothetical protein
VPLAPSNLSASPIQRDKQAHLRPRSELEWFNPNAMDKYNLNRNLGGTHLINDTSYGIVMRPAILHSF